MQTLITPIFSQLKSLTDSLKPLISSVDFFMMEQEIYPQGRTAHQLLTHIALLLEADYKLAQGATNDEIQTFYRYWEKELTSTEMIEARLDLSFNILEDAYKEFEQEDLERISSSYWGTSKSQVEWLLEMIAHLSHHRAQLFSFLRQEGADTHHIKLFD